MDIAATDQVAQSALINKLGTLQEKVNTNNQTIINKQISQDTAYWELKEAIAQVRGDHERLERNMHEPQLQYEALSGRYEDELRFRPEVLEKLDATRKVCDVLEQLTERSKQISARTKADQMVLYNGLIKSNKVVEDFKRTSAELQQKLTQAIGELQSQLNATEEQRLEAERGHKESMLRADSEARELKAALEDKQGLAVAVGVLKKELEITQSELDRKSALASNLKCHIKNCEDVANAQLAEGNRMLMKKRNDLKSAAEEIDSLKKALANQQSFTRSVHEQNAALEQKIVRQEQDTQSIANSNSLYKTKIEELTSACTKITNEIATIKINNEAITKEAKQTEQKMVSDNKSKIDKLSSGVARAADERRGDVSRVKHLEAHIEKVREHLTDAETAFANYRKTSEMELAKLAADADEKLKELEAVTAAIIEATYELETEKEQRDATVAELQNAKSQRIAALEMAEDNKKLLMEKLTNLEATKKAKDEELAQLQVKLTTARTGFDKERRAQRQQMSELQQKLQNIAHEAGRRAPFAPEPEDNAVASPPSERRRQAPAQQQKRRNATRKQRTS